MIATAVVAALTLVIAYVAMRVAYGGAPWVSPPEDYRDVEGDTLDEIWRKMAARAARGGGGVRQRNRCFSPPANAERSRRQIGADRGQWGSSAG
jgi:hypothetical protein